MRKLFLIVATGAALLLTSCGKGGPAPIVEPDPVAPKLVSVEGAGTDTIVVTATDDDGDDITIKAEPTAGITVMEAVKTIPGGAGSAQFQFTSSNVLDSITGNVTFRISDNSVTAEVVADPVPVVAPQMSPEPDTLLAIPLQTEVATGEPVTILVMTGELPNPIMTMTGVRITALEGWEYVEDSFNLGAIGGEKGAKDGVWASLKPEHSILLVPDNFIANSTTLDNGRVAYDFNVTPIVENGVIPPEDALVGVSGALFNFQVTFNKPGTYDLGFQQFDVVDRTFYHSAYPVEGQPDDFHFWGNIANSMEGVANTVTVTGEVIDDPNIDPPLPTLQFSAEALPQSFEYGGSVDSFEIAYDNYDESTATDWTTPDSIDDLPQLIEVLVTAKGAQDLKMLYLDFHYEGDKVSVYHARSGDALGVNRLDSPMSFGQAHPSGTVTFASLMLDTENATGFSGDGVVAKFYMQLGGGANFVNEPRVSESKQIVYYDDVNGKLRWGYNGPGDFSQDGFTNIFDLTPLAVTFGDLTGGADDLASLIAGAMPTVSIHAITMMGQNFFTRVESFNVYSGASADHPAAGTLLGNVVFADAIGDPKAERLYFEFDLAAPANGVSYWVRPVLGTTEGIASDPITPVP